MDLYLPSPLHVNSWLASTETTLISLFLTSHLLFIYSISYYATDNCISHVLHTLTQTKTLEFIFTKITDITAVIFMEGIQFCLLLQ